MAHAGTAGAATAFVAPSDKAPWGDAVWYIADAGETNRVTVAQPNDDENVEITDGGATITAGPGCTSLAPNKVVCDWVETFDVELGDGNDVLHLDMLSNESVLRGGEGNDRILGGANVLGFHEYLFGGPGNDILRGSWGVDILDGGPGADTLSGGTSGEPVFDHPFLPFFPHVDTVTYAGRIGNVRADADGVADDGERGEGDLIRANIEALVGGRGNDVLGGTTTNFGTVDGPKGFVAALRGMRLEGRRGDDVLRGHRAVDRLIGGRGNDILRGNRRADRMVGNRGNDRLIGGIGSDEMEGRRGNDLLWGGKGRDRLSGGIGRDLLLARDGRADRLNGGSWNDSARVDRGLDFVRRIETILP